MRLSFLAFVGVALSVASAGAQPFAYVPNSVHNNVSVINTATDPPAEVTRIPVGINPSGGVAVSPDGSRVYVTTAQGLSVIDTATNTEITRIPVIANSGIVVTPNGAFVYMGDPDFRAVSVIDTASNTEIAKISVQCEVPGSIGNFGRPEGVAVNPNGAFVYVTQPKCETISVINTATNTMTATWTLGHDDEPRGVVVSPDGAFVYVAGKDAFVLAANGQFIARIPVGGRGYGIAVSPDGNFVYVTLLGNHEVAVIDTASQTKIASIPVGSGPRGVAVTPDGERVYAVNGDSHNVSVIDTATNTVTHTIPVGGNPIAVGQFIGPAAAPPQAVLSALGPASIWVGLMNSDAVGLRLDLKAEVFLNSTATAPIGTGQLNNQSSGSSGFNNAQLRTIALTLNGGPVELATGDQLLLTVSVRRTCLGGGHNSGKPRLWYNGKAVDTGSTRDAGSRFNATIGSNTDAYHLRTAFQLSTTEGASRESIDVFVNNSAACPSRPFTPFGTWSITP
jgi:YVTN family beta-propeller protein